MSNQRHKHCDICNAPVAQLATNPVEDYDPVGRWWEVSALITRVNGRRVDRSVNVEVCSPTCLDKAIHAAVRSIEAEPAHTEPGEMVSL